MKEIRETIVEENEMCGFENPNLVNVNNITVYCNIPKTLVRYGGSH
jgi:hypothetical protein